MLGARGMDTDLALCSFYSQCCGGVSAAPNYLWLSEGGIEAYGIPERHPIKLCFEEWEDFITPEKWIAEHRRQHPDDLQRAKAWLRVIQFSEGHDQGRMMRNFNLSSRLHILTAQPGRTRLLTLNPLWFCPHLWCILLSADLSLVPCKPGFIFPWQLKTQWLEPFCRHSPQCLQFHHHHESIALSRHLHLNEFRFPEVQALRSGTQSLLMANSLSARIACQKQSETVV